MMNLAVHFGKQAANRHFSALIQLCYIYITF
jgi:hypothetical protein